MITSQDRAQAYCYQRDTVTLTNSRCISKVYKRTYLQHFQYYRFFSFYPLLSLSISKMALLSIVLLYRAFVIFKRARSCHVNACTPSLLTLRLWVTNLMDYTSIFKFPKRMFGYQPRTIVKHHILILTKPTITTAWRSHLFNSSFSTRFCRTHWPHSKLIGDKNHTQASPIS